MKTSQCLSRIVGLGSLLALALSFSVPQLLAGPGSQYWETQTREAQFKQLKAGDKVAYVCNQCKTVSEIPITSSEQAMGLCKEGDTDMCPSCKKTSKVIRKEKRNDLPSYSQVIYVNEKGEECAFVAKIAEKK